MMVCRTCASERGSRAAAPKADKMTSAATAPIMREGKAIALIRQLATRSLRTSRRADPRLICLVAANIRAALGRAVPALAPVMIGPGRQIEPHNQIVGAMLLSFPRCGEVHQRRDGRCGDSKARL